MDFGKKARKNGLLTHKFSSQISRADTDTSLTIKPMHTVSLRVGAVVDVWYTHECADVCIYAWMWRPELDVIRSLPLLLSSYCLGNWELTISPRLVGQEALLGSACLCSPVLGLQACVATPRFCFLFSFTKVLGIWTQFLFSTEPSPWFL